MLRTPGAGDFIVINLLAWICAGYLWIDQLEKTNPPAWARTAPLALVPLCWSLLVISRPFTLYDSLLNAVPLATLVGLGLILPATQKLRWSLVLVGLLPFFHYALLLLVPLDPLSKSIPERLHSLAGGSKGLFHRQFDLDRWQQPASCRTMHSPECDLAQPCQCPGTAATKRPPISPPGFGTVAGRSHASHCG